MSLLPTWDPIRLEQKIPFNLALCGGRRQGKSTSLADLLHRMSGRFALVIAFIGSAACNPVLEELMSLHWDPRFFFSAWRPRLITALLQQQETLKRAGKDRQVLIVIDDVILDGPAVKQLSNMAMRGRHAGGLRGVVRQPAQGGPALARLPHAVQLPHGGRPQGADLGVRAEGRDGPLRAGPPGALRVPRARDAAAAPGAVQLEGAEPDGGGASGGDTTTNCRSVRRRRIAKRGRSRVRCGKSFGSPSTSQVRERVQYAKLGRRRSSRKRPSRSTSVPLIAAPK
jgi:hypothetical protein